MSDAETSAANAGNPDEEGGWWFSSQCIRVRGQWYRGTVGRGEPVSARADHNRLKPLAMTISLEKLHDR